MERQEIEGGAGSVAGGEGRDTGGTPVPPATESGRAGSPPPGGDGFVYAMDNTRPQVGAERILAGLKEFGAMGDGRGFTQAEFDAWKERPCSSQTVARRFGGWDRGLAKAGLEGGRRMAYSPEELIAHLRAVWRKLGRTPRVKELRAHGRISVTPYMSHWGTLRRACMQVVRLERGEISEEQLLRGRAAMKERPSTSPSRPEPRQLPMQRAARPSLTNCTTTWPVLPPASSKTS